MATAGTLTLGGSATASQKIATISWTSSRGGSGTASGAESWVAGPVALRQGQNILTVKVTDAGGKAASASLTVQYGADSVPPSVTITSPASTIVSTNASAIALRGAASDNVGVTGVKWSSSAGDSGCASGTGTWVASSIPLLVGSNTIVVKVYDAAGNSAWRSLTVVRRSK